MAREPWYVCVRQLVEQRRLAICQVPSAKCQVETAVAQTALHIHGANKGDGKIYSIRETARLLPFAGNCSTPNYCIYLFCELTPSTQTRQRIAFEDVVDITIYPNRRRVWMMPEPVSLSLTDFSLVDIAACIMHGSGSTHWAKLSFEFCLNSQQNWIIIFHLNTNSKVDDDGEAYC